MAWPAVRISCLIALACVLVPVSARAQPAGAREDQGTPEAAPTAPSTLTPARTKRRWYGHQTLIADGAALSLGVLAFATGMREGFSGALGAASILSYPITPALIHVGHGDVATAFGDFLVRATLPIPGTIVGILVAPDAKVPLPGYRALEVHAGAAVGIATGIVAAIAIDAAFLAWEELPRERSSARAPARALSFVPSAGPTRDGVSAGIRGTF